MTTLDAIKLLPMEDDVKMQILNLYPHMEPVQKLSIERLAWNYYDTLFNQKLNENLQKQKEQVIKQEPGAPHLGTAFYKQAVKKTEEDIKKLLTDMGTQVDFAAAKKAMEQIIREMQDAKLAKGTKKPGTPAK